MTRFVPVVLVLLGLVACGEKREPARTPSGATTSGATNPGRAPSGPAGEAGTPPDPGLAALDPGDPAAIGVALGRTAPERRDVWADRLAPLLVGLVRTGEGKAAAARLLRDHAFPPAAPDPRSVADALDRGLAAFDRGDAGKARAVLARVGAPAAKSGRAGLLRAYLGLAAGDDAEYARGLAAAILDGLEPATGRIAAGRLLARLGKLEEAEETLRGVEDPRALPFLALVRVARGEPARDLLDLAARAVKARPGDPVALRTRIELLTLAGRYDEAEAAIEAMGPAANEDSAVLLARGAIRAHRGDRAGAIGAFRAVLALDPGSPVAHRNLAGLLLAEGKKEEAFEHLRAGLAAARRESGLLGTAGSEEGGEVLAEGAVFARGYRELAFRELAAGKDPKRAETCLVCALRADSRDPATWLALAAVRRRRGDAPGAEQALREGSKSVDAGAAPELLEHLAALLAARGDADGYGAVRARIPPASSEAAQLRRLGALEAGAPVRLAGWPKTSPARGADRYTSFARAAFGPDAAAPDRAAFRALLAEKGWSARPATADAVDARFAAGKPALLELLAVSDRGVRTRFEFVFGRARGLAAYFVDDPDPSAPPLLPASDVASGLLYSPDGDPDPEGAAIAKAVTLYEAGKAEEARDALPAGCAHPLAAYVAVRTPGDSAKAVAAARAAHPGLPALEVLYSETQLAAGDLPSALAAANRAAELGAGAGTVAYFRRLHALIELEQGREDAGFRELEALRAERPDYLPVYEDLAGGYLRRRRFRDAVKVLRELGSRAPDVAAQAGYEKTLKDAEMGLLSDAVSREEFDVVLASRDPEVRRAAAIPAAGLAYPDACDCLSRLVRDADPSVRALAVRLIGERSLADALPAVRGAEKDDSRLVRAAVVRTLRLLVGRDAAREMVPFLRDPEFYVRQVAIRELRTLAGRENGYDPAAPAEEREEGVHRWEVWAKSR